MKEIAKAVAEAALKELEAQKEIVERTAKRAAEVLERARKELAVLEEAAKVGASQTFLGASVMLVGISDWPIEQYGAPNDLRIESNNFRIDLHGDRQALQALKGRYKAIVLLYKAD